MNPSLPELFGGKLILVRVSKALDLEFSPMEFDKFSKCDELFVVVPCFVGS